MTEAYSVNVTRLSTVEPELVEWLWEARIPLGAITTIDGDPGLGKTAIMGADVPARVTTGRPMPDGTYGDLQGPASVLLIAPEDGLANTIRPRFDAADGDADRFFVIDGIGVDNYPIQLPDHVAVIEEVVTTYGVQLVVIDSIMATLSGDTNSHRDQDIRRALAPLARMAERTGAAVVLIRHLNKSGGSKAIYRGGGSIGMIGIARAGLLVASDPDDESGERRILANTKSNLAPMPPALAYRMVGTENGSVRVQWIGATTHSADQLLAVDDGERGDARGEAKAFLRDILADGPRPVKEILREARDADISEKTLRRAKEDLGITKQRDGFGPGGQWSWALPETPSMAIDAYQNERAPMGERGHLWRNGDETGVSGSAIDSIDRIDGQPMDKGSMASNGRVAHRPS